MSDKLAAQAQPVAPTSEETAKPAPASGTHIQDDTNLTGSGEAVIRSTDAAERDKPEDIQTPEEWLKNAEKLNKQNSAPAKEESVTPPAATEETTQTEQPIAPVEGAAPIVETPAITEPVEPVEDPSKVRVRINRDNFKSDDDYRIAVKATKLMNEFGLSPANAENEAKRLLGIKTEVATTTTETGAQTEPIPRADGKPATAAEADAKIAELETQLESDFGKTLDASVIVKINREIRGLEAHKYALAAETVQANQRQANTFDTELNVSRASAVEQFPDCAKKDSALTKEMTALYEEWKTDGNANVNSPKLPILLAQRASDRLKRAGVTSAAPAAASPQPVKPARPVQPAAPIASGGTRTTQAAPQNGQLVAELNGISSPADYDAAVMKMTGKRY